MKLPLSRARTIAENLAAALAPACVRGPEIAGSIRREARECGDLELVAIPRYVEEAVQGAQGSLFGDVAPSTWASELWDRIEAINAESRAAGRDEALVPLHPGKKVEWDRGEPRIVVDPRWAEKRTADSPAAGSKMWKLWLPRKGCKVDLFMPSPETWGVVFAIRTGSSHFSKALVKRWTTVSRGHSHQGRLHRHHAGSGSPAAYKDGIPLGPPISTREEEDVFRACELVWKPPALRRTSDDIVPDPKLTATPLVGTVEHGGDLVVTLPDEWEGWVAGNALRVVSPPPRMEPGVRIYAVQGGRLVSWGPLLRIGGGLIARGGGVAVTIDEPIRGFRGCRHRWWPREDEKPFPEWRTP